MRWRQVDLKGNLDYPPGVFAATVTAGLWWAKKRQKTFLLDFLERIRGQMVFHTKEKLGNYHYCFRGQSHGGLTLIETLVAIAIIGILVAMILPAVQAAREGVRRLTCQNRLRQIGLAVHSYHNAFSQLPPSIGPWGDGVPTPERSGKGWIVGILPHLELQSLYDDLRPGFDGDFFDGGGLLDLGIRDAIRTSVPGLHCPSDGSASEPSSHQPELLGISVGLTNYQGVLGDHQLGGSDSIFTGTLPDRHNQTKCNGLFFRVSYQDPQRFRSITDGLSSTYLVGEGVPEHNSRSMAFYANGDYASCHAPPNYFPDPPTPEAWENVVGFRSRHHGGLYFVLCDGSVAFESETIHHDLYRQRSTKAHGSPADSVAVLTP